MSTFTFAQSIERVHRTRSLDLGMKLRRFRSENVADAVGEMAGGKCWAMLSTGSAFLTHFNVHLFINNVCNSVKSDYLEYLPL